MQAADRNWSCQATRILIISKVTSLHSDAKVLLLLKLSLVLKISDVSFALPTVFITSEYKNCSTEIDKFSIAVFFVVVINFTDLVST